MEIEEGNKLIAEFMGGEFEMKTCRSGYGRDVKKWKEKFVEFYPNQYPFSYYWHPIYHIETRLLKFHESWEWLMPVVEKIDDMGYGTIIANGKFTWTSIFHFSENNRDQISTQKEGSKLENTWRAVVEFIQWYNKQEE